MTLPPPQAHLPRRDTALNASRSRAGALRHGRTCTSAFSLALLGRAVHAAYREGRTDLNANSPRSAARAVMQTFAAQSVLAIQNARLFKRLRKREGVRRLHRAARARQPRRQASPRTSSDDVLDLSRNTRRPGLSFTRRAWTLPCWRATLSSTAQPLVNKNTNWLALECNLPIGTPSHSIGTATPRTTMGSRASCENPPSF